MLGTKIDLNKYDKNITNLDPGDWDYSDATELDNMAYLLYIKEENRIRQENDSWAYYTQTGFIDSVGCEKFYNNAKTILRKYKIENIKNEIFG